tara:strand:- start:455 stop:844 length:390 start_codon:yes stop_codon:yes gene_type:complete
MCHAAKSDAFGMYTRTFGVRFRVSMLSPVVDVLWGLSTPMVGVCGFSDWPMLRASNPRIDVACTQDSLVNQTPSVSGWLLCVDVERKRMRQRICARKILVDDVHVADSRICTTHRLASQSYLSGQGEHY